MWLRIDPHSGLPIYLQLVVQLKRAIASGQLRAGDQLPSVRELAEELTVNPNTISRCFQELERDGLVSSLQGRGTFVTGAAQEGEWREAEFGRLVRRLVEECRQLGYGAGDVVAAVRRLAGEEQTR